MDLTLLARHCGGPKTGSPEDTVLPVCIVLFFTSKKPAFGNILGGHGHGGGIADLAAAALSSAPARPRLLANMHSACSMQGA